MDFKKSLKDVLVLVIICAVFATVLAAVNSVTAPIIADRLAGAANQAYEAVMPDAAGFEDIDLSTYTLPATVVEAKRETSGKGFAVKLETKGYGNGMIIIVGVSSDGTVTGATCVTSNETNGDEKNYGGNFTGKDKDGALAVDLIAGSTLTTQAYRNAVVDAINAATIFGGGSADLRTEEEILSDNLNAALGLEGAEFTKMFMVEIVVGVDKIYSENNGEGFVCAIGEQYVGINKAGDIKVVDAEGNEVTDGIEELVTTANAAVAIVSETTLTDVDLTAFTGIHSRVKSCQVTATGNYVFVVESEGHGLKGDEHANPSGKPSVIKVSISAEGVIIDSQTIESNESSYWGGPLLADGSYNSNFIGKTETEANGVDIVAESTNTSKGYKQAVLRCFEAFTTIIGGTN